MNRIKIQDTDLELSRLGLGCVKAGVKWDGQEAFDLFDAFLDMGGNVYDTARVYSDWIPSERGRSERVIGQWLAQSGKRHDIILVSKGGHPDMTKPNPDMHQSRINERSVRYDLEESLRVLGTDYIDIYFYHRDNEEIPVSELIDLMEDFRQQGKIRYYACSNWTTARMKEADAYATSKGYRGFVANEALYNVGEPWMKPMADDTLVMMDEEMQKYHEENPRNLAMPYSSVCNGFFHKLFTEGKDAVSSSEYYTEGNLKNAERLHELMEEYEISVTQAVLGYLTCQKFPCLPLYGPRNIADLKEAMETFRIPFRLEDYPQK